MRTIPAHLAPSLESCLLRNQPLSIAYYVGMSHGRREKLPINYWDGGQNKLVCCFDLSRDRQMSCVSFFVLPDEPVYIFDSDEERLEFFEFVRSQNPTADEVWKAFLARRWPDGSRMASPRPEPELV